MHYSFCYQMVKTQNLGKLTGKDTFSLFLRLPLSPILKSAFPFISVLPNAEKFDFPILFNMFRLSNNLILLINFPTLILSIPIILEANSLGRDSGCEKWLQKPILIFGICIMVMSTVGLIGVCCRATAILCIYLFLMNLVIIALFAFNVFLYVITNKVAAEAVSGLGFEEYRLGDYSTWLQSRVENYDDWNNIKSFLQRAQVCAKFNADHQNDTVQSFYQSHLSSIQSGCCKPSRVCEFEYVSPTVWKKIENGTSSNPDCIAWDNNPNVLCFDCDACKAGSAG